MESAMRNCTCVRLEIRAWINHRFSAFEMRTGPLNTVRNKDKHAANQAFSDN